MEDIPLTGYDWQSAANGAQLSNDYYLDPTFLLQPFPQQYIDNTLLLPPTQQQQAQKQQLTQPKRASAPQARQAYASSCAPCRLRKVRCNKLNGPDEPCQSCAKKGIRCLEAEAPSGPQKRKYKSRSGARIEQAQERFGQTDDASSTLPSPPNEGTSSDSSAASSPSNTSALSMVSIATKMDETQISAAFCSQLVESYYSSAYFQQPCIDWTELRYRFASVGYRPNELSQATQALMSVIVATASRVAIHEGIIGPSPLKSMKILPLQDSLDISLYGEKREDICKALFQGAEKMLNNGRLLLTPNPETIAACYLFFTLKNVTGKTSGNDISGRQYSNIAISQLRSLHENEQNNTDYNKVFSDFVNFTLCVNDSLAAAHGNRALQLSEDDLALFLRFCTAKEKPLSVDSVIALIAQPNHLRAGQVIQPMWWRYIHSTRHLVRHLCGPMTRHKSLDVDAVHDYWKQWDEIWAWSTQARQLANPLAKTGPALGLVSAHVEMCRCCCLDTLLSCHMALKKRSNSALITLEEREQLAELETLSLRRVREGSIALADHLSFLLRTSQNITLASSVNITQMRLDDWVRLALEAPTAEAGGPIDFDADRKVETLNTYISSYIALSYSWPKMKPKAEALATFRDSIYQESLLRQFSMPLELCV